jgi:hypothetical protein
MKPTKPSGRITSFAEKISRDSRVKYKKALDERKKMIRAQYAAEKPLDEMYKAKRGVLDRKISRLGK